MPGVRVLPWPRWRSLLTRTEPSVTVTTTSSWYFQTLKRVPVTVTVPPAALTTKGCWSSWVTWK
ncbi:hypothetical protein D3C72_1646440 [compost metagenome]